MVASNICIIPLYTELHSKKANNNRIFEIQGEREAGKEGSF
jgi:hypothetical protein